MPKKSTKKKSTTKKKTNYLSKKNIIILIIGIIIGIIYGFLIFNTTLNYLSLISINELDLSETSIDSISLQPRRDKYDQKSVVSKKPTNNEKKEKEPVKPNDEKLKLICEDEANNYFIKFRETTKLLIEKRKITKGLPALRMAYWGSVNQHRTKCNLFTRPLYVKLCADLKKIIIPKAKKALANGLKEERDINAKIKKSKADEARLDKIWTECLDRELGRKTKK